MKRRSNGFFVGALVLVTGACSSTGHDAAARRGATSTTTVARIAGAVARTVSYRGVQVDVPRTWPVVDGMHTGFCAGPFSDTPTAYVGPNDNGPPSCPSLAPTTARTLRTDGAWLEPAPRPTDAHRVVTGTGVVLLAGPAQTMPPIDYYWVRGVAISIGVGRNPRVAHDIFESIRDERGVPDTPATLVCKRQAHANVMPAPERLRSLLQVEHGQTTLAPPRPTDRSSVAATKVWADFGPKTNTRRYRVILARYSSRFPAKPTAHGFVPIETNILAWAVYAVPITPIGGCGGSTLDVTNARTGGGIVISGWDG